MYMNDIKLFAKNEKNWKLSYTPLEYTLKV